MKSNKLLKMGVLALTLGALAACGDDPAPEDNGGGVHTCVADRDAGIQSNGTKHWYKCTDSNCKKQVESANHTYGAETVTKPAKCEEAGSKEKVCTVCNYKSTSSISALGHEYAKDTDGNDVVNYSKRASCTEAGAGTKACTREGCDHVENVTENALGHEYAKDAEGKDVVTWTTEVGCDVDGVGTKSCTRCSEDIPYTEGKKGHDIQLVGDDTPAPEGKAKVRVYQCLNGCGTSYLGFKATEVTARSKATLYPVTNTFDGKEYNGYRFFGHPIGNDVEIDPNNGDGKQGNPAVYNKNQEGDFFEYVFDLTAEQAATLGNCKLYCEATPADWLQSTGTDFWRVKGDAANDWTYGMYIDDDPAHAPTQATDDEGNPAVDEEGNPIYSSGVVVEDFRYVLYVDDQLKAMDSTVDTPAGANGSKAEYVLPYTFSLHEGENKIRLVMSGGYRSVFYNFTFRAVEEDVGGGEVAHTHTYVAGDKVGTSAMTALSCECGEVTAYEMVAADLTEGQKAPVSTDKNTRLGKNIFDDIWDITGIEAGTYEVYLNAQVSSGNVTNGYWNSATAVEKGDSEGNNGGSALCNEYKYKVKVDSGEYVNLGGATQTYGDVGLSDSEAKWTSKLATITVGAGATSITVHNMNNGYSLWVFAIRLVKVA